MKNSSNENSFVLDTWIELSNPWETVSLKQRIIASFNHLRQSLFISKNTTAIADVLTQEIKYVWPNVTEAEYENWKKKPHIELPIEVTGSWLVLEINNEPHQKGEEILWI